MTPALALDALITHPRYAEIVTEIRRRTPVGFVDQADAATTEANAIMAAGAARICAVEGPQPTSAAAVPEWIRLGLLDTLAQFVAGKAATCSHSPDPNRPQPVMAAAWRPGLVTCPRCAHLFTLSVGTVADRTCDGCGHVCAGVDTDPADAIYPGMVQLGPLVYLYGTCTRCRPYASGKPLRATETAEIGSVVSQGTTKRTKPRTRRGRGRGKGRRR